jgi:hypothetical protein
MKLGVFAVWVGSILGIKVIQTTRQKCMQFDLVQLDFKKSSELNQTNTVRVGLVYAVYHDTN